MLNKLGKEKMVYSIKVAKVDIGDTIIWKSVDKGHNVEFIKGYGIPMFIPELSKIIYEDVVNRKSDWTLCDYSNDNFIIDANTNTLYAIDFQSYGYYPDVNRRIKMWDNYCLLYTSPSPRDS